MPAICQDFAQLLDYEILNPDKQRAQSAGQLLESFLGEPNILNALNNALSSLYNIQLSAAQLPPSPLSREIVDFISHTNTTTDAAAFYTARIKPLYSSNRED